MSKLANRRSPRWAFMETFRVPQYDGDEDYLTRLRIVQTPRFGLYLHRFDGMRLCDAHSIMRLTRTPTWTLMVVGRRVRTWGYLEPAYAWDGEVSQPAWRWTEFDKHLHAREFDAALARRRERTGA